MDFVPVTRISTPSAAVRGTLLSKHSMPPAPVAVQVWSAAKYSPPFGWRFASTETAFAIVMPAAPTVNFPTPRM